MLGLLLLYFLGKVYYDLAEKHGKSKWGFAILAAVIYYAGTMLGGIFYGALYVWQDKEQELMAMNDTVLGIMAIPFGVALWGLGYFLLKRYWEKQETTSLSSDTLDDLFMD